MKGIGILVGAAFALSVVIVSQARSQDGIVSAQDYLYQPASVKQV